MTSQRNPTEQNLENSDLNKFRDDNQNPSSNSSSSSSRPPISNYRQLLSFKEAAGLTDQSEFVCPGIAKEKIEPLS
jgi:hypothetical protein